MGGAKKKKPGTEKVLVGTRLITHLTKKTRNRRVEVTYEESRGGIGSGSGTFLCSTVTAISS